MSGVVIDSHNNIRVRLAKDKKSIRGSDATEWRTGSIKTARYQGCKEAEEIGEGSVVLIQRWNDGYGWVEVFCGEVVNGRCLPRCNF